jgi:chaperonin GroEL (HSP60 family)
LNKGIDYAGKLTLKYLENTKRNINKRSEIYDLAMITTNKDKNISEIITESLMQTGINGFLNIEESPTGLNDLVVKYYSLNIEIFLKILEGISLTNGLPTKDFMKENEDNLEFKDCLILTCLEKINNYDYLVKVLEFAKSTNKSLILFSPSINKQVESMFIYNKRKNGLNVI